MLKLASPITYNTYISPVCLPPQGFNLATLDTPLFVTGWGQISGRGPTSDVLRQASITVNPLSKCGATSNNQICAGKLVTPVADSCSGDSGGPAVAKSGSTFFLSGIVR